jgi:hypothetical protein
MGDKSPDTRWQVNGEVFVDLLRTEACHYRAFLTDFFADALFAAVLFAPDFLRANAFLAAAFLAGARFTAANTR